MAIPVYDNVASWRMGEKSSDYAAMFAAIAGKLAQELTDYGHVVAVDGEGYEIRFTVNGVEMRSDLKIQHQYLQFGREGALEIAVGISCRNFRAMYYRKRKDKTWNWPLIVNKVLECIEAMRAADAARDARERLATIKNSNAGKIPALTEGTGMPMQMVKPTKRSGVFRISFNIEVDEDCVKLTLQKMAQIKALYAARETEG